MNSIQNLFRVLFLNGNEVYEIYACGVTESDMFGFVEITDIVFDETSGLLVDPAEEKLKTEFHQVKRFYVPVHSMIRVDEVEKKGIAKIHTTEKSKKGGDLPPLNFSPRKK